MDDTTKIKALIQLLDDPDEAIFQEVSNAILGIGETIVPQLEVEWEACFNGIVQQRIEELIHLIQVQEIEKGLIAWKQDENRSLLNGALLLAKYQYSDIDLEKINEFVDQLTQDCWLEINSNLTSLEKVQVINKVFFDIYGFEGNKKNFHSARNSFLNHVIETKKGSPISLSILYIELAKRLKIPIYGVNLPEHFILAYTQLPIEYIEDLNHEAIQFYLNLFNQGAIFEKSDIDQFLLELKIEPKDKFYLPCSDIEIIKRLIQNLIRAFQKDGYKDKELELTKLLSVLEEE